MASPQISSENSNTVATNVVQFYVNDQRVTVPANTSPATSLNDFLRNTLRLTGTKVMCREGGCGACVVQVSRPAPASDAAAAVEHLAINSCLTPVLACADWHITTIEGIGSAKQPHAIQERVKSYNASQCGYCTPGFCMQQHALLANNTAKGGGISAREIENVFDGNICRCTGYRPLLDAMKSFADPSSSSHHQSAAAAGEDIENLAVLVRQRPLVYKCNSSNADDETIWVAPRTLPQLWQALSTVSDSKKIRYIAGHTGIGGVMRSTGYAETENLTIADAYVDLNGVAELNVRSISAERIDLGASVTLAQLIALFDEQAANFPGFAYLAKISAHIRRVANTAVRNLGTWAGNLMLKKLYPQFPSDLAVCFAAAGAQLVLANPTGTYSDPMTIEKFLSTPLTNARSILKTLILQSSSSFFASYKITPREQNAHALMNAAMSVKLNASTGSFDGKPTLVFGNVGQNFLRATNTEAALANASLADWSSDAAATTSAVMRSFDVLRDEIAKNAAQEAGDDDPTASVAYRQSLCVTLLYKFLLAAAAQTTNVTVGDKFKSASNRIERPVSSGQQSFDTDKNQYPVTEPMTKQDAILQCTGEAKYISDLLHFDTAPLTGLLHAAPVLADAGPALINSIDLSAAEKVLGFMRFVQASDIVGTNNCMPPPTSTPEKLLASDGAVEFAGQTVGFVLCESELAARQAASAVKVSLNMTRKPLLTCEDAIAAKSFITGVEPDVVQGDASAALAAAPIKISGELRFGTAQYHFHMETQVVVCEPQDDGRSLVLHAATQWPDLVQGGVASVCGIQQADVDVVVRRIGGAYGAKITRTNHVACMAALGAQLTRRPVRFHMDLHDNMRMLGGRNACYFQYEVGLSADKRLQAIKLKPYTDVGFTGNDYGMTWQAFGDSVYKCPNWLIQPVVCKTDTPPKTWARAPLSTEATFIIENIMEHCAYATNTDPLEFRQLNMYRRTDTSLHNHPMTNFNVPQLLAELQSSAELDTRRQQTAKFNTTNRWKKRALSVVPVQYSVGYGGANYATLVSVHHVDGSVSVAHGGIEIGQGINTKVAQCVARQFGIPLDNVHVKWTTSHVAMNGHSTGASVTSELCARSAIECCKQITARMQPVRNKLGPDASWLQIVQQCYSQNIDLGARFWIAGDQYQAPLQQGDAYEVCACLALEVELDVLTGEHQIRRVDLVYDCGESISPAIDVGQAEGAIVMGLGLYTSEQMLRRASDGRLLTFSTWEYQVPSSQDIPVDMRIKFLQNTPNLLGVLRSKAVGEPPLNMSCAVVFALRAAVDEARKETSTLNTGGSKDSQWFALDAPATAQQVHLACNVLNNQLKLQ